jgi:hypothetical protein
VPATTYPLPCTVTGSGLVVVRKIPVLVLFVSAAALMGQQAHPWSERENLGFKGPVQSVRTTVAQVNPDPRPKNRRMLFVEGHRDWAAFDIEGRRTEYPAAFTPEGMMDISRCAYQADGSKTCIDDAGQQPESREQRTQLPDGSLEVTSFWGSTMLSRGVTRFNKNGIAIASHTYRRDGTLSSEDVTLPNGDEEVKIYDENGIVSFDERTRVSEAGHRFDRWSYDSEGNLVWNLAIDSDGALLSYWYKSGFKPKMPSSDSLGMCRPRLCVDYKFDEQGSGRLEKTVVHTQREGNVEPDSEEHYNFDGILDERAEIRYRRDGRGNWTSRTVLVWDSASNLMVETERDTRAIKYY